MQCLTECNSWLACLICVRLCVSVCECTRSWGVCWCRIMSNQRSPWRWLLSVEDQVRKTCRFGSLIVSRVKKRIGIRNRLSLGQCWRYSWLSCVLFLSVCKCMYFYMWAESGQGFVYSGQIEKGQMHGKGTLVYPNGEKYEVGLSDSTSRLLQI